MAQVYMAQREFDKAEPLLIEATDGARAALGDEHPITLRCRGSLARLRYDQGKYAEALALFDALTSSDHGSKIDPQGAVICLTGQGLALWKLGRSQEAEVMLRRAYEQAKAVALPADRECLIALAEVCDATVRPDEAANWRAELDALAATTCPTTAPHAVAGPN
jgi:tetratricopeptide (TPR) repeat protein